MGIMASSTPFVNGLPFTLLRNGKVQSSGTVGVAIPAQSTENHLNFAQLVLLTSPMIVKRYCMTKLCYFMVFVYSSLISDSAEGNLIHELENALPARVLLKAVQETGLADNQLKDLDYFMGLRDKHHGPVNNRLLICAEQIH